jgi:hypothetical protein
MLSSLSEDISEIPVPILRKKSEAELVLGSDAEALVWSQSVILPPRHERLDLREHAPPACTFDQLSPARALVVHRRNEVSFLLARAGQPPLRKPYTRDAYAPILRRGINWTCAGHTLVRRETSSPKAIPERCRGASTADHLFNQVVLNSTEEQSASAWPSCIERRSSNGDL